MNNPDPLESLLRRQPTRPVPPAWRDEILRAARAAAASRPAPVERPRAAGWLAALLWPHPVAWAGLAAIWLVVLGLNLASPEPSRHEMARETAPPSPQMRELLQQQEQLLAELIGPARRPEADRPKPRSQRADEALNA